MAEMSQKPAQKRPLRTYSNRGASNDTEPPTKRRRTDGDDTITVAVEKATADPGKSSQPTQNQRSQHPTPANAPNPKKGSIMHYFKVTSPSSGASSSCSQDSTAATTTPPVATEMRKRKTRRLTTRPSTGRKDDPESLPEVMASEGGAVSGVKASGNTGADCAVLGESSAAKLNRSRAHYEGRAPLGNHGKRKRQNPKTADVQTTISLSLNDKGFTVCEDCGMVYNPYHEKDIKFHARQHAARQKDDLRTKRLDANA